MTKIRFPTLDEFADAMKGVVEALASDFASPDDDFHPQMTILPGDASGLFSVALDGRFLDSDEGKDFLADAIMATCINGLGGKAMAWVMSAWSLELQGMSEADARAAFAQAQAAGLANHPNRVERVIVNTIDPHAIRVWVAEIQRKPGLKPTLGPWTDWSMKGDHAVLEGRFVEPLQAALRDSSGVPDPDFKDKFQERFGI